MIAARAAPGFAAAIWLAACADASPRCPQPGSYYVYANGGDSAEGSCSVTFAGPAGSVVYDLPPLPACTAKGQVSSTCPAEGEGPNPSSCELIGCGATLAFDGDVGTALARAVGATSFTMTMTCDGAVVDMHAVVPQTACAA